MQSNQLRVEEVESDNIVEREFQPPTPPKRKKKKVSFAVWWELHAPEELKISAESIEQQDASLVVENESITKALETVDQKGDRQPPESESNEKNQVPFKTWSEEHVPSEQEISAGNTEKQNDSLVSEEESTAGVQETIDVAEKEQPSKSKKQPPTTRRNRKKMIPFQVWLEKHAPADLRISAEGTGMENDSLVTKQESISVLQETPEKEQPSTSGTENVKKQDTSLPEEGNQEDSLKKICKEEPVVLISTTQLVTEKNNISKLQKKEDQKGEKQLSKTKRIKKTPLLWKTFPESTLDQEELESLQDLKHQQIKLEEEEVYSAEAEKKKQERRKPFSSVICEKRLTFKSVFDAHMRTHTGEKPFTCVTCGKSFCQKSNLPRHMMIHTGEKPFSCVTCGKSFTQKHVLTKHMMIHTGEKPFSCVTCGKSFTQKHVLTKHMMIHTGEKPFSCVTCGKSFTQKHVLTKHMMIHTGEKPFSCVTCGKSFTQKHVLTKHMMIHTGEKPFSCVTCGKSFTQKHVLTKHMMIHTGEKPFSCVTCGKSFTQKHVLTKHMMIHTGEKPFSCVTCGKSFTQKHVLTKHMMIHTGEKPFSCVTCGKSFTQKHVLDQNQKPGKIDTESKRTLS
uniref:C2H2-type domain-containing protein n=1 Tax=Xiphophorus couchianus TaxID=32473 RepID=A0A3B5LZ20_9TELE